MVSALESKAALIALTDHAADTVQWTLKRSSGSFESRRVQLLDTVPGVVGYYSEGSAALAADFYDESRADARAVGRFRAEGVVLDRTVKIRRGVAWASEPLSTMDDAAALARFEEIIRTELVRPYRDTITTNRLRDPSAAGWKRITSPGTKCGFCRMLAARGAVYRESTAYFAAHGNCRCTCAPVFGKQDVGPEADVIQYMASKRHHKLSPKEKRRLKDAISFYEVD